MIVTHLLACDLLVKLFVISVLTPAIDLVSKLLQVTMRKRYTVDKSLAHIWLQVIIIFRMLQSL